MKKKTLTPQEMDTVIEKGKKIWAELREGFQPEEFEREELEEIMAGFGKLEVAAYKCKIGVWLNQYTEEQPSMNFKELLIKILAELPNTLSVAALKELIDYTGEKWNEKAALVTA